MAENVTSAGSRSVKVRVGLRSSVLSSAKLASAIMFVKADAAPVFLLQLLVATSKR